MSQQPPRDAYQKLQRIDQVYGRLRETDPALWEILQVLLGMAMELRVLKEKP